MALARRPKALLFQNVQAAVSDLNALLSDPKPSDHIWNIRVRERMIELRDMSLYFFPARDVETETSEADA